MKEVLLAGVRGAQGWAGGGVKTLALPLEPYPAQARKRSEVETWSLCLETQYWPSRNGGARPLPFPIATAQRRHLRC